MTNGLVEQRINGRENLMPRFIYNDQGDTMWLHIERELSHCSAFTFVIAFITERALAMLKAKLADIAQEGVHGRIITADYLDFNNPKVFRELKKLPNVEVRIAPQDAFHAKGYLFAHQQAGYQSAIIGSANLTQGALLQNYEWNIEFTSHENGALTGKLMAEVEAMWADSQPLTDLWIDEYREEYDAGPKLISLTDAD
ncbi:phospholipase D-like domain-containing protein [Levilactobacillus spicheri]